MTPIGQTREGTERPILFSGPMVRAILGSRKTQTRRVIRNVPPGFAGELLDDWEWKSPYGDVGDRLWVRETWYCDHCFAGDTSDVGYLKPRPMETQIAEWKKELYFRADGEPSWEADGPTPWKPSIHMPRWASRITLEVTGVRVERLQDITLDDCEREGVTFPESGRSVGNFAKLWDSINAKRGYGWDKNPWVWVVSFRRAPPTPTREEK